MFLISVASGILLPRQFTTCAGRRRRHWNLSRKAQNRMPGHQKRIWRTHFRIKLTSHDSVAGLSIHHAHMPCWHQGGRASLPSHRCWDCQMEHLCWPLYSQSIQYCRTEFRHFCKEGKWQTVLCNRTVIYTTQSQITEFDRYCTNALFCWCE